MGAALRGRPAAAVERADARDALVLNVNVSTRRLERPGLLAVIDDLLAHGLDPACLVLEITETALSLDEPVAARTLQSLCERKIHLALDDFGTGYSSLTRLREAPLSRLKIDRASSARSRTPAPTCPSSTRP